jgi:hypothetical protein
MAEPMTKLEEKLFQAWLDIPGVAPKEYEAYRRAVKRNQRQRARRATPEAKAKEAHASRISKARRLYGYDKDCSCRTCTRARDGAKA